MKPPSKAAKTETAKIKSGSKAISKAPKASRKKPAAEAEERRERPKPPTAESARAGEAARERAQGRRAQDRGAPGRKLIDAWRPPAEGEPSTLPATYEKWLERTSSAVDLRKAVVTAVENVDAAVKASYMPDLEATAGECHAALAGVVHACSVNKSRHKRLTKEKHARKAQEGARK